MCRFYDPVFRVKWNASQQSKITLYHVDDAHRIVAEFNMDGDNKLKLRVTNGGSENLYDCGTIPDHESHTYSIQWYSSWGWTYICFFRDQTALISWDAGPYLPNADPNIIPVIKFEAIVGSLGIDLFGFTTDWNGTDQNIWNAQLKVGSTTVYDKDAMTDNSGIDNSFYGSGFVAFTDEGTQTVEIDAYSNSANPDKRTSQIVFDDFLIWSDKTIHSKGLQVGQKVELGLGSDVNSPAVASVTQPAGQPESVMDVSMLVNSAVPVQGIYRIYNSRRVIVAYVADGDISGGDECACYEFAPSEYGTIYTSDSEHGPHTWTCNLYLKNADGSPVAGKLVHFATNLCSVYPLTSVTLSNGLAQTVLTAGTRPGFAIVQASLDNGVGFMLSDF